jgi:hypothetical protein
MEKEGLNILGELIKKDLQLDEEDALIVGEEAVDLNTIHKKLGILIIYLIENDMHRLLNALYRLDVSEPRFHDAMNSGSTEEAASLIADLIIEREMQKVKTRLHYRKYRKF